MAKKNTGKNLEMRTAQAYRETVRELLACYQQCIEQLRRGERNITWPPGTYAPGVMLAA